MAATKASGAVADLADDARAICLSGQEDSREAKSAPNETQVLIAHFPRVGNYFGDCPHCRTITGYFNIGREQWCYCEKHQLKWCFGENILSSWRDENKETWLLNEYRFGHYREVEPFYSEARP